MLRDLVMLIIGGTVIFAAVKLTKLQKAPPAPIVVSASDKAMLAQLYALSERAYFDGQREALQGDVRIAWSAGSQTWSWTKSPWDEGMKPTFDPAHQPAPVMKLQAEKP